MTRGDQRDRDRERAKKRAGDKKGGKKKEAEPFTKRLQKDADIMRLKQLKAQQKKKKEMEDDF